jgi:hypothetical protein
LLFFYLIKIASNNFDIKSFKRIVISTKDKNLLEFKEYYKKMKTFRLIAVSFIFAAIFAVSAFAQATAQPAAGRIGLVNTFAFGGDDKGAGGITKYKNAMTSLDAEFKTVFDKLKTMDTRRATLAKEIQAGQNQPSAVPSVTTALQAKIEEYQALEVQMKREQNMNAALLKSSDRSMATF